MKCPPSSLRSLPPRGGSQCPSGGRAGTEMPAELTAFATPQRRPVAAPRAVATADHDAGAVLPGVRWALARDLRLALRSPTELGVELLFYVIVISLFPLAAAPQRELLTTMGPGVLWVAALLASLLSLPRLFASDYADGTLAQIALSPFPLPALVFGKVLAHWLTTGLPIAVLAPIFAGTTMYRLLVISSVNRNRSAPLSFSNSAWSFSPSLRAMPPV